LIKIIILEENFKWYLEAFASELFIYRKKIQGISSGSKILKCLYSNMATLNIKRDEMHQCAVDY